MLLLHIEGEINEIAQIEWMKIIYSNTISNEIVTDTWVGGESKGDKKREKGKRE